MRDQHSGDEGEEARDDSSARPGAWARLKRWMQAHHMTLMALPDTAHAIALGSAIGMFFGFTPLFGLKTLLSLAVAWLLKGNKIASFISVTLHDIILPFWPAIFLWEYRMGMWALHRRIPERAGFRHVALRDYMEWTTFFTVGQPLLVGSLFLALPAAVGVYFLLRALLIRARAKSSEQ
ncbi:MAG: hypothetical protein DLM73_04360 [Chthoniobacterales bacterium]|nr:MAG: hypothetical protein DLM73_04360 [Chthoniobacterales bacterium]